LLVLVVLVFSRVLELVATPRWPRDELEAAGRMMMMDVAGASTKPT
jgi:hypothetical protein